MSKNSANTSQFVPYALTPTTQSEQTEEYLKHFEQKQITGFCQKRKIKLPHFLLQ